MPRARTGHVRSRNGKFYARVDYRDGDGKRRHMERIAATKAEATRLLRQFLILTEGGPDGVDGERMTFRELAEAYRRHRVFPAEYSGDRKTAGLRDHRNVDRNLTVLADWFGDRRIKDITPATLDAFKRNRLATPVRYGKDGRLTRPRMITTVNRELQLLRAVLYFAQREGWIAQNPFQRTKGLVSAADEARRTRILSRDEEARLLALCVGRRAHLRAVIICALDTALRRGEIYSLEWPDVDLQNHSIHVRALNTKTLQPRSVPITARLADELLALAAHPLREDRVFPYNDLKKSWTWLCRKAEIAAIRFHDLRATAITRMLQSGVPSEIVMKISGHTQPQTFLRYTRPGAEELADVARRLDESHAGKKQPLEARLRD